MWVSSQVTWKESEVKATHTTCKQSASAAAADNNPKAKRSKLWPIQWPITLSCFEHFLFIRVSYKLHPRAPRPMLQNGVWQGQLFIVEDSLFERENASAICYLLQTVAKSLKTSFFLSLWTKEVLKSHKFSLYFLRNVPFFTSIYNKDFNWYRVQEIESNFRFGYWVNVDTPTSDAMQIAKEVSIWSLNCW